MSRANIDIILRGRDQVSAILGRVERQLGGIAGRVAGFGTAIAGSLAAYFSARELLAAADAVDKIAKQADRLQLPIDRMQALRLQGDLTGASMESIESAMARMMRTLSAAAGGSQPAIDALERIGLSADQLAGMSADQAMGAIADGLNRIDGAATRAATAQEIFGRGAMTIDNLLRGGSEGIAAANAEIDRMGIGLSRVDAAKVEEANDAWTRMTTLLSGATQSLVVEMAPTITAIVGHVQQWMEAQGGVQKYLQGVVERVIKIADFLQYYILQPLYDGGRFLGGAWLWLQGQILSGIDRIGSALVQALNIIPGVRLEWTSFFAEVSDAAIASGAGLIDAALDNSLKRDRHRLANFIKDANERGQAAAEAAAANALRGGLLGGGEDFTEDVAARVSAVDKFIAQMERQANTFGMSAREAQLYEAALEGVTDAQLAQARALIEQLDAMDDHQRAVKRAEQIFASTRTQQEKQLAQIEELERLMARGVLDADTFARAMAQLAETVTRSAAQRSSVGVAAVEARFLQRAPGADVQVKIDRNTAQTAKELGLVRSITNRLLTAVQAMERNSQRTIPVALEGI
ncbi:MAG: hypothetical protein KF847_19715 [Pirellulales bacterium]|nr:hypothetical protein [Pirellulales bacterium]